MPIAAPELFQMSNAETKNAAVNFSPELRGSTTLTGTPTITVSPSGPTLSNKVVSSSELTIKGVVVPAAEAVQFRIAGAAATAGRYIVTITVSDTDSAVHVLNVTFDITA